MTGHGFWQAFGDSVCENFVSAVTTSFAFTAVTIAASNIIDCFKCFKEGTLVETEDGLKPIEEIEVGDKVLAYDEDTGEQAYKKVTRLFRNETKEWYHISVNGEEIICTAEHPFYLASLDKFIPARELKLGDTLLLSDNTCVIIEEIQVERLQKPDTTYNFEVEDFHTYYVSESKVLVHNDCVKKSGAKAEIEGKAHGAAKHRAEINKIAQEMADSGEYSKIYLNRSLHTTGVQNGSYLRPDIIGVKNGGGFKIVEVASRSQASGRALNSLMNNVAYYESIVGKANVSFIPWGY